LVDISKKIKIKKGSSVEFAQCKSWGTDCGRHFQKKNQKKTRKGSSVVSLYSAYPAALTFPKTKIERLCCEFV
jgi:hypothetical protein